jgi:pimeloyl-ACP methyl ester carboxylesterase
MRHKVLIGVVVAIALLAGVSWASYARDMRAAYARIDGRSSVVATPYGDVEYAQGGSGRPVLVVHGSGGGFDQGELLARAVLGSDTRWIAPSRFGYLRSTSRAGATFDDQAHAYASLLDSLGVQRVAVIALSHGGPSALLFALLHPERVSSLTLISAGVASSASAEQSAANRQGNALTAIFQRDYRYWAFTRAFRGWFLQLMGVTSDVIASLTPGQRALADAVIDGMNPVSRRAAGVTFDNRAAMPNERVSGIRVPTLVLHGRDDTLQLFSNAEFAASHIPGARLVSFARGGHLVLAVEQVRIRQLVAEHLAVTAS